jgi:hypothetical protein
VRFTPILNREILMGYEIKYDTTDRSKSETKALADVKHWLGTKQFNKVAKILASDRGNTSRFMVTLALSMQGIEGYPAEVMVDTYWNPQRELF